MTSTSQPESEANKGGSSSPTPSTPDKEPQAVPLGEHIEMRKDLRKALDEVAALKEQLAKSAKPVDPADSKTPSVAELHKTLQELQNENARKAVIGELGLTDVKQADAVVKLMQEKGLAAHEALSIAASRSPDIFAGLGGTNGNAPQFGSLTPRPGSSPQPKPDDDQLRSAYIKSLHGKDERTRERYLDNRVGHFLAESMGWEHQLLPLPQQ